MVQHKKVKTSCFGKAFYVSLSLFLASSAGSFATVVNDSDNMMYDTDKESVNTTLSVMQPQQQNKKITGTVTDQSGEPIIGASVYVKGTAIGTTTGVDGKYTITVPSDSKISFDFLG